MSSRASQPVPGMVSTVITSFNKGPYLRDAIESALAQEYQPHEVIVIDDESTDNTRQVAESYGRVLRYYWQENQGPAGAKSRGISEARGEYIAFLDGDDIWHERKLARQMPLFAGRPHVAVVYSPMVPFANRRTRPNWSERAQTERLRRGMILDSLLVENCVPFSTAVVRRSILCQIGMLNEKYRKADDYDLWLRIAREWEFDFVGEPLLAYWAGENRIGAVYGSKLDEVLRIQADFLEHFYPDGFPRAAVVRAATARKYSDHGDCLLGAGRQFAAFAAYLTATRWEPARGRHYCALARALIPNRIAAVAMRTIGANRDARGIVLAQQ